MVMGLKYSRITTLKWQNNNNHLTETLSLKTAFWKIVFNIYMKGCGKVAFICKCFYIKVLIKELGIVPDGYSSSSYT